MTIYVKFTKKIGENEKIKICLLHIKDSLRSGQRQPVQNFKISHNGIFIIIFSDYLK